MNLEDDWFGYHHTGTRGKGLAHCFHDKCYEIGGNSSPFSSSNSPVPSSVALERFFSQDKNFLKAKRASLADKTFGMLMFMRGKQTSLFGVNGRY